MIDGLTPDATGLYFDAGEYNGKRSYQRAPNGWFLWWESAIEQWGITALRGETGVSWWTRVSPNIEGAYQAGGDAIGEATVTET